ncbi:PREDICTED: uncharacterized protein LOC106330549 [Brassica oleracea var. oleracea]|uniref:uncharacterized protein LOC106330549 n=1 Tax=Brassica oleracea var. oleracea TaxID=109376 RepID=UPI0006A72F01|nr:PREDICTED: uncharacterized protein LOC106330549 [Brassica oleracea var. oleracea]
MVLIYVKSGVWMSSFSDEWSFLADKQRRGRMVTLETTTLLEELKIMVCEDYGVDPNLVNVEFSYEMVNQRGNPPISISNDRQVCNFVGYAKKGSSTTLCVTFSGTGTGVKEKERVNIDLNKEPCDSSNVEEGEVPDINLGDFAEPSTKCCDKRKNHVVEDGSGHAGSKSEKYGDSEKESRAGNTDFMKKYQLFRSKHVLKATMEIWAMKNNYDFLHAWEAREYAIAAGRGIPDESYAKIPKYLHMIEDANPGSHTHYETKKDGRFMYLFMPFGQSVRGFHSHMRRVIVVDGTFLKNKYKGVLLVATAVDGNSNLYPIAFGVADSENEESWEWFFRQLSVVIPDSKDLAFVSDRHASISKAIKDVYPRSKHGICIHHLLTNVVKFFRTKGFTALVEKASKAYRYDIRTNNPAESINSALRSPRQFPVEKKIDRRIVKARGFQVQKVDNFRSLVKGDIYDCHVDRETRTCTCGKFNLGKIPCRHAIPAIYSRGMEVHRFTDGVYSTATWRAAYAESINPIPVPEAEWNVPDEVKLAKILPPESRKSAGRPVKRRYERVEDKIRSSQGSTKKKKHKCSRCDMEGHKRGTCDKPI